MNTEYQQIMYFLKLETNKQTKVQNLNDGNYAEVNSNLQ